MAVSTFGSISHPTDQGHLQSAEALSVMDYSLFGMHVQSAFPLLIPSDPKLRSTRPDLTIIDASSLPVTPQPEGLPAYEARCYCPRHNGQVVTRIHHDSNGSWIWNEQSGTCRIHPEAQHVEVYLDESEITQQGLAMVLSGLIPVLVLNQRGQPCLHGSSVETPEGAVLFLGPKGQGKSSMAAGLMRLGATLVTDDILPLQRRDSHILGIPGPPAMKLWQQSIDSALGIADELPRLVAGLDKKLFTLDERFSLAACPVPIRAVYLLQRFEPSDTDRPDITSQPLHQRQALMALTEHTSLRPYLKPADIARSFPMFLSLLRQAPVRFLAYPSGFSYQESVYEHILEDLKGNR